MGVKSTLFLFVGVNMKVLGLDPSLTNFGWAIIDTDKPSGDKSRCVAKGLIKTQAKMEFIERYKHQRQHLKDLIEQYEPDYVGIEFPVFNNLWSEGMYGLFLFCCEALKDTKCDVVFWSPLQVKAYARLLIDRPKGWAMDKMDMCEAAKVDGGFGRINHNEADAYHVARLSASFWNFYLGNTTESLLNSVEKKYFTKEHTFSRGKKAGKTVRTGMMYREEDRFFLWSQK